MRISDWSADVCSSDLLRQSRGKPGPAADARRLAARIALAEDDIVDALGVDAAFLDKRADHGGAEIARGERRERAAEFSDGGPDGRDDRYAAQFHKRSEERRVGEECVGPCRSRWSPDHSKKHKTLHRIQITNKYTHT